MSNFDLPLDLDGPPQDEALFVATDLLQMCQGLQEAIAAAPADQKDEAGNEARRILGSEVSYHGSQNLEIRTLGAYALPDGLTLESQIWPVIRLGEIRLRGFLAQVAYVRIHAISSLAWMIMDPLIRSVVTTSDGQPPSEGGQEVTLGAKQDTLRRPLYLPVGMIESVLVAA